jgi:hypothetical protein
VEYAISAVLPGHRVFKLFRVDDQARIFPSASDPTPRFAPFLFRPSADAEPVRVTLALCVARISWRLSAPRTITATPHTGGGVSPEHVVEGASG